MGTRRGWPGESTGSQRRTRGPGGGGGRRQHDSSARESRANDGSADDDGGAHEGGGTGATMPRRAAVGRARPPVPTGRAALGALLVVTAAVGAVAVAGSGGRDAGTRYVVARRDLDAGTVLGRGDLGLATLRVPGAQASGLVRNPASLEGTVVLGPMAAGELVQRGAVARLPGGPGARELSLPVDPSRAVGGRLRSGDRVDVLATFGTGADGRTEQVATGVLVVRADGTPSSLSGRGALTLTLAVDDTEHAVALAHAAVAGEVTIVRSTGVTP